MSELLQWADDLKQAQNLKQAQRKKNRIHLKSLCHKYKFESEYLTEDGRTIFNPLSSSQMKMLPRTKRSENCSIIHKNSPTNNKHAKSKVNA